MRELRRRWNQIHAIASDTGDSEKRKIELDMLYAAVLDTPDGLKLLDHFRDITLERVLPMDAPDGALRELEAQRRFVRAIESRILRHRERAAKPKAK